MATVDRINGLTGNLGIKTPVRVATTANITLSGLQTIDGVTVVANDRVLVKNQTDATENGIYAASSTAWTREPDFDGSRDIVKGTLVRVNEGTASANLFYGVTSSDPITIDSSNITFASAGIAASTYIQTLLDDTTAAAARTTLGSTAVGDAVFTAANAAAARAALALGTASIYDVAATGSSSIPQLGVANTFSAVQTFSSGVNLGNTNLTNYTEGTFTPTAYGSSTPGSPTYSTQLGAYTRIGRMVFYQLRLKFSALTGMVGSVRLAGLPFTASSGRVGQAVHGETLNMAASAFTFASFVQPSTSEIWLYKQTSGGTTSLPISDITATTDFYITGMYYV